MALWPVQVANRSCLKCMDSYCDTCYTGMHRTGQMKWHRWKPLTAMCHTCKVGAGGQQHGWGVQGVLDLVDQFALLPVLPRK